MISAYQSGIPGNGTPFPDGAKMAQIHWNPTTLETLPTATVPASLHDVDFNGEGQQGTLKNGRVEQSNFHNYRVSRMNETPSIEVHLVRNDEALGGIGEPGTAVTAAALASAIYAVTGKRATASAGTRRQLGRHHATI